MALEDCATKRKAFKTLMNKFKQHHISRKRNFALWQEKVKELDVLRKESIQAEANLTEIFGKEFQGIILKMRKLYFEDKIAFSNNLHFQSNQELELLFSILMYYVFEYYREELKRFHNSSDSYIKDILQFGDASWSILIAS